MALHTIEELRSILNGKTCWSSLCSLVKRFWALQSCVPKTCFDDGVTNVSFELSDLDIMEQIASVLKPVTSGVVVLEMSLYCQPMESMESLISHAKSCKEMGSAS